MNFSALPEVPKVLVQVLPYIYIYTHTHTHPSIYIYIYIYIYMCRFGLCSYIFLNLPVIGHFLSV